ncbi:MAG: polysaccharide deacetylase family protein [Bryobacteraceae bacterium]
MKYSWESGTLVTLPERGWYPQKPTIITTSWDDGAVFDDRLAKLLDRFGIKGTFYLPLSVKGEVVNVSSRAETLLPLGMEIGAHTLTHPTLSQLDEAQLWREIGGSKQALEQILGQEVTSFCYPKGKFDARCRRIAKASGYVVARTTESFCTQTEFDPFAMPVTLQVCPHTRTSMLRHMVKGINWRGLQAWSDAGACSNKLDALADGFLNKVLMDGGTFHLWGHSWEIERYGLWQTLEVLFERISGVSGVQYLTNTQAWQHCHRYNQTMQCD